MNFSIKLNKPVKVIGQSEEKFDFFHLPRGSAFDLVLSKKCGVVEFNREKDEVELSAESCFFIYQKAVGIICHRSGN